ncbi:MAG: preprotein translocase subunit SecE [Lachnospiraceae bacterium]
MAETKKEEKKQVKKKSFWQGVKTEWKKIIWPTKKDLGRQTVLVVVISVITGGLIAAIDSGALTFINWLLSLG